jgi:hypothetical protein
MFAFLDIISILCEYTFEVKKIQEVKNMIEMLSYEIAISKMQEMHRDSKRRQILNSVKSKKQEKPVIQRIVHTLAGIYHAYGST